MPVLIDITGGSVGMLLRFLLQDSPALPLPRAEQSHLPVDVTVGEAVMIPSLGPNFRSQRLCLHFRYGKLDPQLVPVFIFDVVLWERKR